MCVPFCARGMTRRSTLLQNPVHLPLETDGILPHWDCSSPRTGGWRKRKALLHPLRLPPTHPEQNACGDTFTSRTHAATRARCAAVVRNKEMCMLHETHLPPREGPLQYFVSEAPSKPSRAVDLQYLARHPRSSFVSRTTGVRALRALTHHVHIHTAHACSRSAGVVRLRSLPHSCLLLLSSSNTPRYCTPWSNQRARAALGPEARWPQHTQLRRSVGCHT